MSLKYILQSYTSEYPSYIALVYIYHRKFLYIGESLWQNSRIQRYQCISYNKAQHSTKLGHSSEKLAVIIAIHGPWFCNIWSLSVRYFGNPYNKELCWSSLDKTYVWAIFSAADFVIYGLIFPMLRMYGQQERSPDLPCLSEHQTWHQYSSLT